MVESKSQKVLEAIENQDLVAMQLHLVEALHHDPPEVLASLAASLQNYGYLAEAKQIYGQLLTSFPYESSLKIALAEIAIEDDELDQAFDYLESIEKSDENYPESLLVLADLYQMLAIPEVSEQKLREAKTYLPHEPLIDWALAELYFSVDKFGEALEYYQKLEANVADLPKQIHLNNRLGQSLSMLGEFEEAIPYLEASVEQTGSDEDLYTLGLTYLQVGDRERAIVCFMRIQGLNPQFELVYVPLVSALIDEQKVEEANKMIEIGLQQNPYNLALYYLASDFAYQQKDLVVAEEFLRRAISLEDDSEFALLKLANLFLVEERFEDVIDVLEEYQTSDLSDVAWTLAQAHYQLEHFSEAATFYQKASTGLQDEPDFLKEYGLFLREEGRQEESRVLFQKYLAMVPDDLEVASLMAE